MTGDRGSWSQRLQSGSRGVVVDAGVGSVCPFSMSGTSSAHGHGALTLRVGLPTLIKLREQSLIGAAGGLSSR